jgi:hypothetical protein
MPHPPMQSKVHRRRGDGQKQGKIRHEDTKGTKIKGKRAKARAKKESAAGILVSS